MTAELESAGALATATLAASELAGEAGKSPATSAPAHGHTKCANCGTSLVGLYCHTCGQTGHVHRSLLHIGEELLHGILHFDTRSWRTLPLLAVRPGLLTRRYIDGQRSRYVSPLALFLFSVFLMFFTYSFTGSDNNEPVPAAKSDETREQVSKAVEQNRQLINEITKELAAAKTPEEKSAVATRLAAAANGLTTTTKTLGSANVVVPDVAKGGRERRTPQSLASTTDAVIDATHMDTKHPTTTKIVRHAVANPELTLYKLKSSAYKFAFMLVPISLPFMWLLFFWHRGVRFYDHAIFLLYSLSFNSLWFAFIAVLSFSSFTHWLMKPAVLYVPVHIFLHVKETYGLGGWGATWRTFALMFAGTFIFLVFMLMILAISLH